MHPDVLLVLKLIAISGLISGGIKILGQFLTLDTPPVWVPLTVVMGTMGGAGFLLVWRSWRDSPPLTSPHKPSGGGEHRLPPPPETGD
jgi:MFS superfamily sulfate permease-like transporter